MPENQRDIQVGKRLQVLRRLKGLSQEQVGAEIGVTFQQIQKYERGVNGIRASKLYGLARLLGVSVDYFFEEPEESDSNITDIVAGKPDAAKVLKHFSRIHDPKLRACLVGLVNAAANGKIFVDRPEN